MEGKGNWEEVKLIGARQAMTKAGNTQGQESNNQTKTNKGRNFSVKQEIITQGPGRKKEADHD